MTDPVSMLSEGTVEEYLRERGVITGASPVHIALLAGGVSNIVLGVRNSDIAVVVKQSLAQLDVPEQWLATRERTNTEAAALQAAHHVTPGSVPKVIDINPAKFVLVIEWVEHGLKPWKPMLLDGIIHTRTAGLLGSLLATWHTKLATNAAALSSCGADAFDQLRVDPFYRSVARRNPQMRTEIENLITTMSERTSTFVHGDYSPKNVLADPNGAVAPVVVDFEVAHYGDPAFDVAFMITHLLLKSVAIKRHSAEFRLAIEKFLSRYQEVLVEIAWTKDDPHLARHVGALLLARLDGKSPVDYLDFHQREEARNMGASLLFCDYGLTDLIGKDGAA